MKVHARFITACGCTKDMVLDHATPAYVFPMMPTARIRRGETLADYKLPKMQTRTFRLERTFGYEDGWMAEYREELAV